MKSRYAALANVLPAANMRLCSLRLQRLFHEDFYKSDL